MYLSQIKLKEIQEKKDGNNNWVFIYDRSGSMYHVLKKLGDDLIRLSSMVKVGDTISIAYFSGQGQYRFIAKGFLVTSHDNIDSISTIIKNNIHPIGLTCFSEILSDTIQTINELKITYPMNSFVLVFLTDGVPIPGGSREESSIFESLKTLKGLIGDALFVGYGDYYGKELMSKMTSEVNGSFVHADSIEEFSENVEIIIKNGSSSKKIEIDISNQEDVILVFGKSNGQIKIYPHSDGKAYVSESEKDIFVVNSGSKEDASDTDAIYAGAYSLASQNKIGDALEWLGKIGDKYLVDKLNNAFTTSEIGEAVKAINAATFDESKRMLDGYRKKYVPKANAFCALDAVEALVSDKDAYFYPNHSKWEYKRTGAKSKMQDGYVKFDKDKSSKCSFRGLSWNKKRLNLSVRTTISGSIDLTGDYKKHNLNELFQTYQHKTFSIIKDGILNLRKIPISMSEDTFIELRRGGLIKKTEKYVKNEIYVLDLKRIPLMNRVMADSYNSAQELAEMSLKENELMAKNKTLKYFLNAVSPEAYKSTPFSDKYTDEQMEYLLSIGIKSDGSYSPLTDVEKTDDYYMAKTFEIKVSGFSSLPKVEDVIKKGNEKKKMNKVTEIMWNQVLECQDLFSELESIKEKMKEVNKEIKDVRNKIQKAKFAVILGKQTFKEFDSNEGEIIVDGIKINFVFGEDKVKY